MIVFWVAVLFALFYIQRLRAFNLQTTVVDFRFRLYKVRDSLRGAAIDGEIDSTNWVFQYLDSSICKTITVLSDITVLTALVSILIPVRDREFEAAIAKLHDELQKEENQLLAEFHGQYITTISEFLWSRHPALRFILKRVVDLIKLRSRMRKLTGRWKRMAEFQTESPETSTLRDFAY